MLLLFTSGFLWLVKKLDVDARCAMSMLVWRRPLKFWAHIEGFCEKILNAHMYVLVSHSRTVARSRLKFFWFWRIHQITRTFIWTTCYPIQETKMLKTKVLQANSFVELRADKLYSTTCRLSARQPAPTVKVCQLPKTGSDSFTNEARDLQIQNWFQESIAGRQCGRSLPSRSLSPTARATSGFSANAPRPLITANESELQLFRN